MPPTKNLIIVAAIAGLIFLLIKVYYKMHENDPVILPATELPAGR
jgi:hypothetical protein